MDIRRLHIIVIHIGNLYLYPPVISLLYLLQSLGIKTTVITTKNDEFVKSSKFKNVRFLIIPVDYEAKTSPLFKLFQLGIIRGRIQRLLNKIYGKDSVIWITNSVSLKHAGSYILYTHAYILQLMELSENLKYHRALPFSMNAHKIGNSALAVVVPEYNRAHITKAWWDLKYMPMLLPNKPFYPDADDYSYIEDDTARKIIEHIGDRKIILYQGIISSERPLDDIIKAVKKLGSEYVFLIMSGGEDAAKYADNLNIFYIPFLNAPKHLQITCRAYIGILSYCPSKTDFSRLNAVYCAPNKIFEYSMFGIPMIANDVPGLKILFDQHKCGECYERGDVLSFCDSVRRITAHYDEYKKNAFKYYHSVDNKENLSAILSTAARRKLN